MRSALVLLAAWPLALACGLWSDEDGGAQTRGTTAATAGKKSGTRSSGEAQRAVARLATDPQVDDLLTALRGEHRRVRVTVGPHQLRATVTMATSRPDQPRPKVGEPRGRALAVVDTLELDWFGGPTGRESFRIKQFNQQPEGNGASKALLVLDEQVYLQQDEREWFQRAREDEEGVLWLEDVYRCVVDAVELGAPALALERLPPGSLNGSPTTRIGLSRSSTNDTSKLPSNERSEWRAAAKVTELSGEIELDPESGAWLSAKVHVVLTHSVDVAWRLTVDLDAQLRPGAPAKPDVPADALPLPRRERYEPERARLLDGLAGG